MSLSRLFLVLSMIQLLACTSSSNKIVEVPHQEIKLIEITGKTQGTTYTVKYEGDSTQIYQDEITTILREFDDALSLWVPSSALCKLNLDSTFSVKVHDPKDYFKNVFSTSKEVYRKTNGYFDPSIDKIVEALGLGLEKKESIDFDVIKKLRTSYSFDDSHVSINDHHSSESSIVIRKKPNTTLNFNAIAQGYSVDVIHNFLKEKGHNDFYVEIGGELRVRGRNQFDEHWVIGIDRPSEGERHIDNIIKLENTSLATSGSYRKYIIKNGRKYSHTINPLSGLPVDHNLLSVTVLMESCALADAYATAFMAMGKEKTIEFVKNNDSEKIEIFLMYQENNQLETYASLGFNVEKYEQ